MGLYGHYRVCSVNDSALKTAEKSVICALYYKQLPPHAHSMQNGMPTTFVFDVFAYYASAGPAEKVHWPTTNILDVSLR